MQILESFRLIKFTDKIATYMYKTGNYSERFKTLLKLTLILILFRKSYRNNETIVNIFIKYKFYQL